MCWKSSDVSSKIERSRVDLGTAMGYRGDHGNPWHYVPLGKEEEEYLEVIAKFLRIILSKSDNQRM
jgi:hypothetical protein